ncbi:MAG: hypothetical protein HUK09_08405 [Bacteroidaceae bacterium]|nr:hypothetical protein [Bacteroidaceae bacterium]
MDNALAPVALFVYNRLDNTRATLQHLVANTLAPDTDLYIFADGGKDPQSWAQVNAVRDYLREFADQAHRNGWLQSVTLVERPTNYYLERNIIEGIDHVLRHHDRIIVLEDDICTAPHFLAYMNEAFALYVDHPKVMHITGFTHLDLLADHPELVPEGNETYFTRHAGGWGWGTWRDRWQQFVHYATRDEALAGLTSADLDRIEYGSAFPALHSLDRSPIPWDICWELAVYRARGLALAPAHTLVRNIGLTQGTHFGRAHSWLQRFSYDRPPLDRPLAIAAAHPVADERIEALFAEAITDWGIRYTLLGRIVRRIYRWLRPRK